MNNSNTLQLSQLAILALLVGATYALADPVPECEYPNPNLGICGESEPITCRELGTNWGSGGAQAYTCSYDYCDYHGQVCPTDSAKYKRFTRTKTYWMNDIPVNPYCVGRWRVTATHDVEIGCCLCAMPIVPIPPDPPG